MGSFLDIEGDPNEVSGTGALLRAMGESLQTEMQGPLGDIHAIEGERPWGSDHFGEAFDKTYDGKPPGSDVPLREAVQEGMSHAGERLTRVGDGTIRAMTEYQGMDSQNAQDITTSGDA